MAASTTPVMEADKGTGAVLIQSVTLPEDTPIVRGFDFNKEVTLDALLGQMRFQGFQGTSFGEAIDEMNRMLRWRMSEQPWTDREPEEYKDPAFRRKKGATIFFGYTSNQISCGNREVIRYLCQHKLIDAIVTTGGGIEEDFLKCMAHHYVGDFALKGSELRKQGLNRIGNLLVPNNNYCKFEDFVAPILEAMHDEQDRDGVRWTPSAIINRLGKEINNPESVYYWCYKNDIPVFCPAITDGSVGDMIFFHCYKREGFIVDIAADIFKLNNMAMTAKGKTGMIILGGGLVKHHVCNANLMRNGADFAVFINTGQEFDGSDSGAKPDEAVSWGKIRLDAKPVKVYADASLVFPLLVSQTFVKEVERRKAEEAADAAEAAAAAATPAAGSA